MIVSRIKLVERDGENELRARIRCASHWVWGDEPFELWYRFPSVCRTFLSEENGDPFLASMLLPAVALGEPLEIQAPVSERLLRAVPTIQAIYRSWHQQFEQITVVAPVREASARTGEDPRAVGLFYSLGIDSSYSLLKNRAGEPGDEEALTHLVSVLGFDVYLWERQRYQPVLAHAGKVATATGKELLPVSTNLRDFSDRMVDWLYLFHGPALASVALALGGFFRRVTIAASQTYSLLTPLGSHPLVDPLWSTEDLAFAHDGLEATRLGKVRQVARSPLILEHLRVCTTSEETEAYNCGHCAKCVATMVALHIAGALARCPTLPDEIDLEEVRGLRATGPVSRSYYEEFVAALGDTPPDLAIKSALQEALASSPA